MVRHIKERNKTSAFDIRRDTVNLASRLQTAGEVGRVNISAYTYDLAQDEFAAEYRGKIDTKGKGAIDMYFVIGEIADIAST